MSRRTWTTLAATVGLLATSALSYRALAQAVDAGDAAVGDTADAGLDAGVDAAPELTSDAAADGAAGPGCTAGRVALDRAGHCCYPGQHWGDTACRGTPTSCLPGYVPHRSECAPRACEPGLERAADGVHCCWPGLHYDDTTRRCAGEAARCPEGTAALGASDCAPPVGLTGRTPPDAPVGMAWVASGVYPMGPRAAPRYVALGSYWIDRTEVTLGAYARCVAVGVCPARSHPFVAAPVSATQPVANVTHAMAAAYCGWAGGRLPTEAEWELAARGVAARTYPWGERLPDCALAWMLGCGDAPRAVGRSRSGASLAGALDMAGNVAEWTATRAGPPLPIGSHRDPVGPTAGDRWVVRGGSFESPAGDLRATARATRDGGEARYDVGFRCVRSGR